MPGLTPFSDYGSSTSEWLKTDWREHLRVERVSGADVNLMEIGSGPPVVMVHGLGGRWQNWLENIPHLARRHRVIAMDLPGFGSSPMPPWDISIPAYGKLINELTEKLGLDKAAIVGNSMGGFIATEAVTTEPERYSHLTLVSAAGISFARSRQEPAKVIGRMSQMLRPILINFGDDAVTRPRLRRMAFRGVLHRPGLLPKEALWELAQGGLGPPGFGDALVALTGYDIRERLNEIEIPTLIVWGFQDRVVPVRAALSYRRRIKCSRLEIFDRTGHVPMIERPDRFNELMDEFLAE